MKITTITLTLVLITLHSFAQNKELAVFNPLVGKVWKAEGNWGDGSKFKQEIIFSFDLNHTIVIAESKGFTNQEQTEFGSRNHGIRKYNKEKEIIEFWEFDVFGGLTTGTVVQKDKNIIYTYQYGTSTVTDMWQYVDDHTYIYKVGSYENGEWKQVYLETKFEGFKP